MRFNKLVITTGDSIINEYEEIIVTFSKNVLCVYKNTKDEDEKPRKIFEAAIINIEIFGSIVMIGYLDFNRYQISKDKTLKKVTILLK